MSVAAAGRLGPAAGPAAVAFEFAPGVGAAFTGRSGGVSSPPYDTLNMSGAVGDEPAAVAQNRQRVAHQDPRYFRSGEGSIKGRAWYALTRIVVARMDSGRNSLNFSEWGGNAAAVAISNAYYPDTRTAADNAQRLLIACGTDALDRKSVV